MDWVVSLVMVVNLADMEDMVVSKEGKVDLEVCLVDLADPEVVSVVEGFEVVVVDGAGSSEDLAGQETMEDSLELVL